MDTPNEVEETLPGEATASTNGLTDDISDNFEVETAGAVEEEATASTEQGTEEGTPEVTGEQTTPDESGAEGEQTDASEESSTGKQPQHKNAEERITELITRNHNLQTQVESAESKYNDVMREIQSLQEQMNGGNAPAASTGTTQPKKLERPKMPTLESVDYDNEAHADAVNKFYADMELYQEQNSNDRYQQREAARLDKVKADREVAVVQARNEAFSERQTTFMSQVNPDGSIAYPDYEQAVFNDTVRITVDVGNAIKGSPNGPQLLYTIAKSPKLMNSLLKMPTAEALMTLGELNVKISSAENQKQVSNAPDPIDPINGAGDTQLTQTLENMPMGDFMAQEEKKYWGDTR